MYTRGARDSVAEAILWTTLKLANTSYVGVARKKSGATATSRRTRGIQGRSRCRSRIR